MDLRSFFFRNRSYTSIPLALVVLYFADREGNVWIPGIVLVLLGELLRLVSIRYVGGETRTRRVGAKMLCTSGPFAYLRNPIYLGNIMIYSGGVLIAGGSQVWLVLAFTFIFFAIQYGLIISLEEETLSHLFSNRYDQYRQGVPRIIPRLSRWPGAEERKPSSWSKALKREKRTLQTLAAFFLLLLIRVQWFS